MHFNLSSLFQSQEVNATDHLLHVRYHKRSSVGGLTFCIFSPQQEVVVASVYIKKDSFCIHRKYLFCSLVTFLYARLKSMQSCFFKQFPPVIQNVEEIEQTDTEVTKKNT